MGTGNCSATLNNTKLVHWPLMGELVDVVRRVVVAQVVTQLLRRQRPLAGLQRTPLHVFINPLECRGDYPEVTSNGMKLVHWPLMGGLLHLVHRGGDCTPPPAQAPPRCTKCYSLPINGQ